MNTRITEGHLSGAGLRVGIVASRFNAFIVDHLIEGAMDALTRTGCSEGDVEVFRSPGSFEIPQIARRLATSGRYDVVICLGAVIRGSTPHFEYVAAEAAKGIAQVALQSPVPVTFGVLTTDTIEQAIERAGTKSGNKGFDAAMAAIEMASLVQKIGDLAPTATPPARTVAGISAAAPAGRRGKPRR